MKRLPPQHNIECATEEKKLPNGNSFYLPSVSLNLTDTVKLTQEDQDMFGNFIQWVDNYNDYIISSWDEKSRKNEEVDNDVVDDIIDSEEIPFE
jgi:flagellar capping protein FliD